MRKKISRPDPDVPAADLPPEGIWTPFCPSAQDGSPAALSSSDRDQLLSRGARWDHSRRVWRGPMPLVVTKSLALRRPGTRSNALLNDAPFERARSRRRSSGRSDFFGRSPRRPTRPRDGGAGAQIAKQCARPR